MKYNFKLISAFCLLVSSRVESQVLIKGLNVGDSIPDIELRDIVNYQTSSARISDFKGKLLIIDFWATWCSPCVAAFNKLDSLQKEFKSDIQILPVTYEDKAAVSDFLKGMYRIKNMLPISVTNDEVLDKLFRHKYLPHYVWINGNEKVIAITEANDVNRTNIRLYLQGKPLAVSLKKDNVITLASAESAFLPALQVKEGKTTQLKSIADSDLIITSSLTKYIDGLSAGASYRPNTVVLENVNLLSLYKTALYGNKLLILNHNSLVVDIPDTILYEHITGEHLSGGPVAKSGMEATAWLKNNAYCYKIAVPGSIADQKYDIMLSVLNQYFGALYSIEGIIEKRRHTYLALIRTSNEDKIISKREGDNSQVNKFSIKIENQPISALVGRLAQPLQNHPFIIDETNYTGKVDIELNCELSDLGSVNRELMKYGLELIEKEKLMDFAVIRMKTNRLPDRQMQANIGK